MERSGICLKWREYLTILSPLVSVGEDNSENDNVRKDRDDAHWQLGWGTNSRGWSPISVIELGWRLARHGRARLKLQGLGGFGGQAVLPRVFIRAGDFVNRRCFFRGLRLIPFVTRMIPRWHSSRGLILAVLHNVNVSSRKPRRNPCRYILRGRPIA